LLLLLLLLLLNDVAIVFVVIVVVDDVVWYKIQLIVLILFYRNELGVRDIRQRQERYCIYFKRILSGDSKQ
jgi:hypothetical protein